jgi:cytoskeletal protein RodZ
MLFTRNKIKGTEESVAEKLRRAREEKNLAIEAVAKKLAIGREYLLALENGDYKNLPSGVYGKTYLKKYSLWLGLDWPIMEQTYNRENSPAAKGKNAIFAKKKINALEMLVLPKILKNILIAIFIATLFLYIGYYSQNSFSEPKMIVSFPPDNLTTEKNTIEIIGQAKQQTQILINGKQITKDENGAFSETISLKKGLNSIVISAKNKYSRSKIITKQILVK